MPTILRTAVVVVASLALACSVPYDGDGASPPPRTEAEQWLDRAGFVAREDVWLTVTVRGKGLFAMRPDGSGLRMIDLPVPRAGLAWALLSPDGQQALYGDASVVVRAQWENGWVTKDRDIGLAFFPRWSLDGRSTLGTWPEVRGDSHAWVISRRSLDGKTTRRITLPEDRTRDFGRLEPLLTRDGILFHSVRGALVRCALKPSGYMTQDCVDVLPGLELEPPTVGGAAGVGALAVSTYCAGRGWLVALAEPGEVGSVCTTGHIVASPAVALLPPALSDAGHVAYASSAVGGFDVTVIGRDGSPHVVFRTEGDSVTNVGWTSPGAVVP